MTTLFKNIYAAQCQEIDNRKSEKLTELKSIEALEGLNHWTFTDYLPKGRKINDFKSLEDAKAYLLKRIEKNATKSKEKHLLHLLEIEKAGEFKYFNIQVEWKKSQTWGANPRGEGYDYTGRYDSGSVGGCGYDKLSTAVANVLNQSKPLLKALYLEREKDLITPLRELFGYGSGYGILPRIEGGVGVSCYPEIFKKIGFNFRQTANGKMFDAFEVTKLNKEA